MSTKAKTVRIAIFFAMMLAALSAPSSPWLIVLMLSAWALGAIDGIVAAFDVTAEDR